jgi:bilirubin oxidase
LHGKTLNQVVKGASGFIIVHDAEEVLLNLPRTYGVDDVPLVFQWKTFDANKQIVELDEEDNEVLVNGVVKGSTLSLPAQVVRLRLLNGSSHRFFNFGFENALTFKQIGGDGGLLDAPVSMSKLILAPGERAEILVDLTGKEGQNLTLRQYGSLLPQGYPGGRIGAINSIPATLTKNAVLSQVGATGRTFGFTAQPMMSMTNFYINGLKFDMEQINFSTTLGKTEIWTITNQTMMAHPFHVHGNSFYVLSINGATPAANMRGRKDVITIPPMTGSVKIIMKFEDFSDPKMPYMYHCHILSHEDDGMMGQFIVNGSPTSDQDYLNDKFKMNVFPNPSTSSKSFL